MEVLSVLYQFCAILGKRHGRSIGMRHVWRSSSSGVRAPVRPSVQGPVGEVPATAPFNILPAVWGRLYHRQQCAMLLRHSQWQGSDGFL